MISRPKRFLQLKNVVFSFFYLPRSCGPVETVSETSLPSSADSMVSREVISFMIPGNLQYPVIQTLDFSISIQLYTWQSSKYCNIDSILRLGQKKRPPKKTPKNTQKNNTQVFFSGLEETWFLKPNPQVFSGYNGFSWVLQGFIRFYSLLANKTDTDMDFAIRYKLLKNILIIILDIIMKTRAGLYR